MAFKLIVPFVTFGRGFDSWRMHGWCSGFWFGGFFMWLILLIIFGVMIYLLFQMKKSRRPEGPTAETPIEILKKRYAKGEITRDEFAKMKKDLEGM